MATPLESTTPTAASSQSSPNHRQKRARVTLACQRCKTRKQKCDGTHPSCSSCMSHGAQCRYILPLVPTKPAERKAYIKALEDRISDLEARLVNAGQDDVGSDKWRPELFSSSINDAASILSAVRDVSLNASGYNQRYVGGSTAITLGRVLGSVIGNRHSLNLAMSPDDNSDVDPKSIESEAMWALGSPGETESFFITSKVADRLYEAYIDYFATNFLIANSVIIGDFHSRRELLTDSYEKSILRLVYSAAGRFLETSGETGNYYCVQNFDVALENREEIFSFADTRTLTYLLLLAFNCIRAPREPGTWTYIGLAMRLCVELGLHRRKRVRVANLESEIEKRLFWSCYYLDREVSIALGRPFAISDRDIDVELPLEVNENEQDTKAFKKAMQQDSTKPATQRSDLSCFVHLVRLKRIESEVQHTIYRVDTTLSLSETHKAVDHLLAAYSAWRDVIPNESREWKKHNMPPTHSEDAYMISYHKAMRTLLQPQLYETVPVKRYLDLCCDACVGVCATYRRLHHNMQVAFSTLSLQTVFLAGLTLIYCMWHGPSDRMALKTVNALHDASILLYVMAERWPATKKYRDVFEAIKTAVMDKIEESGHQPRQAVRNVAPEVKIKLREIDSGLAEHSIGQMVGDMTGEHMSLWSEAAPEMEVDSEQQPGYFNEIQSQNMSEPFDPLALDMGVPEGGFMAYQNLGAEWPPWIPHMQDER